MRYFRDNTGIDLCQGTGPVHLLSCYAKSSGAAQALADALNRPVIAYSNRSLKLSSLTNLEDSAVWLGSKMGHMDLRRLLAKDDFKPATPRTFFPSGN